ncbi:MAG: ABC transporter substrate-binding protein [Anaerolineae bacterium]|nr:ABC transporter substrate-binding protein [Anaerolineae bacterium]
MRKRLTRRKFLYVSGVAASVTVAACAPTMAPEPTTAPAQATAAPTEAPTTAPAEATALPATPASKYSEAPELAALVAEGKLPPVDERLPKEPLVVEVVEEIGQYGGVWRQLHMGTTDLWQNYYKTAEFLGKFNPEGVIVPNVAKGWEFSDDGKTITIYLREGMKWSDGAPFTTDDVMFWYEDIILNDELTPAKPSQLQRAGKLGVVEKVDDYTFTITWEEPYGAFYDHLSTFRMWQPAHYLKRFHAKYARKEELEAAMKEEGFDTWTDLFGAKTAFANNPGTPDFMPWNPTNYVDAPVQVWERNPYYYKVDPAGNQLPYINRLERTLLPDAEAILLKAIAGEADFESRRIENVQNYPVVKENEEKGGYRVILEDNAGSNIGTTFFNYAHQDEYLRELFLEKDFRVAMSHALDRQEIADIVHKGLTPPSQVSVAQSSIWWEEWYSTNYIEYDPDKTNELLDSLGLDQRDDEGYRLRPDGQRLMLINYIFDEARTSAVEMAELSKDYWNAVGVNVVNNPLDRQLWEVQTAALEHDLSAYIANFGHKTQTPIQQLVMFCVSAGSTHWARAWALWYQSGGREGVEPPEKIKELQSIYEQCMAETSVERRNELIKQACANHAENLWMIGVVNESDYGRFMVVKNNLRNVPDHIPGSNALAFNVSQMFFKS